MPVALLAVAALVAVLASQHVAIVGERADIAEASSVDTAVIDESVPHTHLTVDGAELDHAHDDAAAASVDPSHQHPAGTSGAASGTDGHAHDTTAPGAPASGPIVSVDDPRLTAAQQQAASSLLSSSRAAIASLPNASALAAAGYVPVGDNSGGMQHWVNDAYTHDGRELDPSHVESFMTSYATGRTTGAMYILEPGKSMANVPDIAGELTIWHVHQPICFSDAQPWHFVSFASNRNCPTGSTVRDVPPMMHVWADDPPCGPFVGTEGHGSTSCDAHAH